MDSDYKLMKAYLRAIDINSMKKICRMAELTEDQIVLITMYYGEGKTEDFIADYLGMSLNAYHNARMDQVHKIMHFLRLTRPEGSSFQECINEIERRLRW